MKKQLHLLVFIYLLLLLSCNQKKERGEIALMDCIFQSYNDKGMALKKAVLDYETLLIEQGFLKDNSGKSYRDFFDRISKNSKFENSPSTSFSSFRQNFIVTNSDKIITCDTILSDSLRYNLIKIKGLKNAIEQGINSGDINSSVIAKNILNVLSEKDFDLLYYKISTFNIIDLVSDESGLINTLPYIEEPKHNKEDLSNALNIFIDESNNIFVREVKKLQKDLRKIVSTYYSKNKSKSIVIIKYTSKTSYTEYIALQNEVINANKELRNKLSIKKYNLNLDNISTNQLNEIKKVYPLNIIEKE